MLTPGRPRPVPDADRPPGELPNPIPHDRDEPPTKIAARS